MKYYIVITSKDGVPIDVLSYDEEEARDSWYEYCVGPESPYVTEKYFKLDLLA